MDYWLVSNTEESSQSQCQISEEAVPHLLWCKDHLANYLHR